jgi:hypothetical protein
MDYLTEDTQGEFDALACELPGFTAFYTAYVETALWASTDEDGQPLDTDGPLTDLPTETVRALLTDAADFYRANFDVVSDDASQAGHDFWLTRNGHGAGFWDGDWPEGERELTIRPAKPTANRRFTRATTAVSTCCECCARRTPVRASDGGLTP